jgi:hypothetical protein
MRFNGSFSVSVMPGTARRFPILMYARWNSSKVLDVIQKTLLVEIFSP